MAVTVIPDLTTIADCDTVTNWSAGDLDTDSKIQGTACLGEQVKTTTGPVYEYSLASPIALTGGEHLYVWMLVNGVPDTKALGGYRIYLESTAGNDATWYVGGNDTLPTGWNCVVLDPSGTTADASNGTLDLANINIVGVQFKTLTTVVGQANNVFWDVLRYGYGLIATGTSFTLEDIADDDQFSGNQYGILQKTDGVLFCQGRLTIGDGTNTTELNSENEVVAFRDREVDGDLYQILFTGSNTSVTAQTLTVLSAGDSGFTRPNIDVDSTVTNFTMAGSNIRRTDEVQFNPNCEVTNTVFTDCNTIYPTGCTFYSNTIANSNSVRALKIELGMSAQTDFSACTFIDNFSAATWIEDSGATGVFAFNDHDFINNLYDLENSSGGDLTVNLSNSNASSSLNSAGGSVTFVSTTNYTLTDLEPDTEVRIYTSGTTDDLTTAGDELYGVESVTGSTTFQYGSDVVTSGQNVVVMIHNVQYETIRFVTDLDGTDTTQQIQQQFDRNYENP